MNTHSRFRDAERPTRETARRVAALIVLTLSACSGESSTIGSTTTVGAPVTAAAATVATVLDAPRSSVDSTTTLLVPGPSASGSANAVLPAVELLKQHVDEVQPVIFAAVRSSAAKCAEQQGYFGPIDDPSLQDWGWPRNSGAPWAWPTPEHAGQWGYSPAGLVEQVAAEPPQDPTMVRILWGDPIEDVWLPEDQIVFPQQGSGFTRYGGCLATAWYTIAGNGDPVASYVLQNVRDLVGFLISDAITTVLTSPEWQSVEQLWLVCMSQSGIDVASLQEQRSKQFGKPYGTDEIREATADAECMRAVGATDVAVRLLAQQSPPEKYVTLVDEYSKQLDEALERAKSALQ